eukprot:9210914-Lingulodinium_polyedra.AAC.1
MLVGSPIQHRREILAFRGRPVRPPLRSGTASAWRDIAPVRGVSATQPCAAFWTRRATELRAARA